MIYSQGKVLSSLGISYIIFKYKGKFYIDTPKGVGNMALMASCKTGYDTLEELHEATGSPIDLPAFYLHVANKPENAELGDIFEEELLDGNYMILCSKKCGKRVWVDVDALKNNDLNYLLHLKCNRYGKLKLKKGAILYDGMSF